MRADRILRHVTPTRTVEVRDEPAYMFGSADNAGRYQCEHVFGEHSLVSSRHGVICSDCDRVSGSIILGSGGGASAVHDRSLVIVADTCLLAIGPFVTCLSLPRLELAWSREVDAATCFGIHLVEDLRSVVTHGELEICRLSLAGEIQWRAGGADIFTGDVSVVANEVHAVDFNGKTYVFDINSGVELSSTA